MPTLTLTPAAAKFIERMVRFGGGEHCGFRLVVSPGGCSGLNSEFSVEAAPQAGDEVVELAGLRLFLPAASAALLDGASVDFADTATSTGLVFQTRSGGCGCSSAPGPQPEVAVVGLEALARRPAPGRES
ncbi:MAG: iron-sulfur cluster assembly accessory protein [Pseudomonadales bacterium]|nr:iron-sulfur cluster assembly accessory protein [Pseudomonadales bacterium]